MMPRPARLLALTFSCLLTMAHAETLRFGMDLNYPPFSSISAGGNPQGFDVDIAYALCREMKVDCLIVSQDWDGLIPALKAGKFDAILSSMQITRERRQLVDFSDRYYKIPSRLIAREGSRQPPRQLAGWRVGVLTASTQARFAEAQWERQGARVAGYRKIAQAFDALAQGKLDAVFVDSAVGDYAFLQKPQGQGFAFVGPEYRQSEYFGEGTGIAVRKGDLALATRLDRAIASLRASGQYRQIERRYFGFDLYGKDSR
ncbi:transporter substrate-binding domain-containing protein [Crenobacter caeni]|nr:transporter substrate-binding domain-containing protein [Crenobacter caeni]